jgi:hypothetical protein
VAVDPGVEHEVPGRLDGGDPLGLLGRVAQRGVVRVVGVLVVEPGGAGGEQAPGEVAAVEVT